MDPQPTLTQVALTIAGSDSSGGAGIQADLKTFAMHRVYGTSATTCVTAQNPRSFQSSFPVSAQHVIDQIDCALSYFEVGACKTGMLYSSEILEALIHYFRTHSLPPLVIDPVLISSSNHRLLEESAVTLLQNEWIPRAALWTPNIPEAEALGAGKIKDESSLIEAAKRLHASYDTAVLVKGGHLENMKQAMDVLCDDSGVICYEHPAINIPSLHGTGCTLSAAITAHLAKGTSLRNSIEMAKSYLSQSVQQPWKHQEHWLLGNHFFSDSS